MLEEQRPNVFTMSVANVMPEDVISIELHYTELIEPTDGIYQFVFPTVVGPRYSNKPAEGSKDVDKFVETPYMENGKSPNTKFDISVDIMSSSPVNNIACKSHKIDITGDKTPNAKVTLANKDEISGDRDFILNYSLTGNKIQSGLMLYEGDSENFFMLDIQPPERVNLTDIPPREYIFLLDVSGSMYGYPIDCAKVLIKNLISNLRDTDKFNLVLFSGSSDSMSDLSVSATKENISRAIKMIDKQDGSGGTEFIQGLKSALSIPKSEYYSRSVIIITDGYIDCEKEAINLINENINNTNFFSFGIGSSINRYLIEGIAKTGLGEPFFLTESDDAKKICDDFRKYVSSPLLRDIKIEFNGFKAYDVEPRDISTLFAQRPVKVLGKYKGIPEGSIKITGKTATGDFFLEVPVAGIKPSQSNSALSYLWARTRLARISDYSVSDENDDTKAEITALGLNYSILTPYTSFIAVSETIRNTKEQGDDISQPLTLPRGVSTHAVGGYRRGSEPEVVFLVVGMSIMILIAYILRKRSLKV
ncbi:MAG: von Willebrand factor type A domain protein [Firmicutes bacterium ADurb.Bin419]|nr:MAG: von Willebrand factor type A domain protein [Firmicutes bacterium ADurb.Bin419]